MAGGAAYSPGTPAQSAALEEQRRLADKKAAAMDATIARQKAVDQANALAMQRQNKQMAVQQGMQTQRLQTQANKDNAAQLNENARRERGYQYQTDRDQQLAQNDEVSRYNAAVYNQQHAELQNRFQEERDYREHGFNTERDYNQAAYQEQRDYRQQDFHANQAELERQHAMGMQGNAFEHQQQMQEQGFVQNALLAVQNHGLLSERDRAHYDLQARLNQTQLSQADAQRMQTLQRQIDYLNSEGPNGTGRYSAQEVGDWTTHLRTQIDPLQQRANAAQILQHAAQTNLVEGQAESVAAHNRAMQDFMAPGRYNPQTGTSTIGGVEHFYDGNRWQPLRDPQQERADAIAQAQSNRRITAVANIRSEHEKGLNEERTAWQIAEDKRRHDAQLAMAPYTPGTMPPQLLPQNHQEELTHRIYNATQVQNRFSGADDQLPLPANHTTPAWYPRAPGPAPAPAPAPAHLPLDQGIDAFLNAARNPPAAPNAPGVVRGGPGPDVGFRGIQDQPPLVGAGPQVAVRGGEGAFPMANGINQARAGNVAPGNAIQTPVPGPQLGPHPRDLGSGAVTPEDREHQAAVTRHVLDTLTPQGREAIRQRRAMYVWRAARERELQEMGISPAITREQALLYVDANPQRFYLDRLR